MVLRGPQRETRRVFGEFVPRGLDLVLDALISLDGGSSVLFGSGPTGEDAVARSEGDEVVRQDCEAVVGR